MAAIGAHQEAWAKVVEADHAQKPDLERERLVRAADDVMAELVKTPPTTLAGARAVIKYVVEWDKDCDPRASAEYLKTLLRSPIFAEEADRVLAQSGEART